MITTIDKVLLSEKSRLILAFVLIISISFTHIVFKPFQMAHYPIEDYIFVNIWYFVISTLTITIHLVLFPKHFSNRFKALLNLRDGLYFLFLSILLSTGILFFTMKIVCGYYPFSVERVVTGILALVAIGIIPLAIIYLFRKTDIKKNVSLVNGNSIFISDKYGEILVMNVLYVYSDKNYVIWVFNNGEEVKKMRVRDTIKGVESRLTTSQIIKSHRAFLVNRAIVEQISKCNSSHIIKLKGVDDSIPLSRNYRKNFIT